MTIEILDALAATSKPADRFVDRWFRDRRFAGSGDRREISELVYAVLRRRAELAWRARDLPGNRALVLAALGLVSGWTGDQIKQAFDGGIHRPTPLTEAEIALVDGIDSGGGHDTDMPPDVVGNYPKWLEPELAERFGGALGVEMAAMNERAPVDLRVNTLKSDRTRVLAALAAEDIEAEACSLSPLGVRLKGRKRITGTKAFRGGWMEIQDEAAQLAALLVDARPDHQIADVCAGAGGKTLAMAAAMENKGQIQAWDVDAGRLERLRERAERAGARNIQTRRISATDGGVFSDRRERFDRVLLDLPCSGTGTWRRNPETKWRMDADALDRQIKRQRAITSRAAEMVRPGGRLVYATCSILNRENDEQITWFLAEHDDFRVLPAMSIRPAGIGDNVPETGDYLKLTPASNGTDGFFTAVLERRS